MGQRHRAYLDSVENEFKGCKKLTDKTKIKIKTVPEHIVVDAQVCQSTKIATINMFGMQYKFSHHEYEIVGEQDV